MLPFIASFWMFFLILGLDILEELSSIDKSKIIECIYSWLPVETEGEFSRQYGFLGCPYLGQPTISSEYASLPISYRRMIQGHIAMTYTALASLLTLGDDLSRVDKDKILKGLAALQQADGSFSPTADGGESDARFVYCAACICSMLNDFSGMDVNLASAFLVSCLTYEGAFGLVPGSEAQGGATFCSTSALVLMDRLTLLTPVQREDLVNWCLFRQCNGFQGRTNKEPDSCYSFWVGATLELLDPELFSETDSPSTEHFLLQECQYCPQSDKAFGFSKQPYGYPDILHTFYSIGWLTIQQEHDPILCSDIPAAAADDAGSDPTPSLRPSLRSSLRPIDCRLVICRDKLPAHLR